MLMRTILAASFLLQNTMCFHLCSAELYEQQLERSSDIELYDEDFVALVEMVYGEGLLSQGGLESINEMFQGLNLEGLKMLDLGSGLGMHDIYLAKNHRVEIIGIDPQQFLIQKANANLMKQKKLKGSVSFQIMKDPNNLKQFSDNTFDIVFSKEAILHVPNEVKNNYFKEIYRVLKPGGQIVIMDWMHRSPIYSENTRKMMEMDDIPFQLLTPSEYQDVMKKAGFKEIQLTNTTAQHALFSQQNIETIKANEDKIKSRFGEDAYKYSLESWGYQRDAFNNRELITGIFRAVKK